MQIVIDIPNWLYNAIMEYKEPHYSKSLGDAVRDGTPLPKGHGRIGDLDGLIQTMKARNDDNGGEPLNAVDRGYDLAYQHMVKEAEECVIIKADKESEG